MDDETTIRVERLEDLEDTEARYFALMDTLNVDFEDMFPDWPET